MIIPIPNSGSPEPDGDWYKKIKKLLDAQTSINSETGCWEFEMLSSYGYGRITIDHKEYLAHRLSAMMFLDYNPEFSDTLHVLHKCSSRNCWNPHHLYIGTNDDNIRDKVESGTGRGRFSDVTHCVNGHEFTPENTYWFTEANGNPGRQCRECKAIRNRKSMLKRKEKRHMLKFKEGA